MSGPDHKASMELRDFYSFVYKLKNIDVTWENMKKMSKRGV